MIAEYLTRRDAEIYASELTQLYAPDVHFDVVGILDKIESCDIFAPDVTFVCKTEEGKLIPNPNVMFESGYAFRARTYKAMMPIMNTASRPPEKLPFDMGHLRHPITYCIEATAKNAERRAVRARLSEEIEQKLRLQIAATQPPLSPPPPFPRAEAKDGPAWRERSPLRKTSASRDIARCWVARSAMFS